ncbi:MAG: T9SS C-terminal target domain-containing protein [Ignavibacteriae bacterium]|nr:MAG: T9SS C-terminal target domain-containing protein [Ignavibacteriota bacterium]
MKLFKLFSTAIVFFLLINLTFSGNKPSTSLENLLINAEINPQLLIDAQNLAISKQLPVRIYLPGIIIIQATGIENGEPVYAVMTNPAHPFIGEALFFDELNTKYNLSSGKIDYGNGNISDNTGGMFEPVLSPRLTNNLLLVPDWTMDKVIAFDAVTGNIVDTNFVPSDPGHLSSPRHALQAPWGKVMVADQVTDAVQEYDTSGTFIRTFASTNLDNIRGVLFKQNQNLLVTVGSGSFQNTVQQFNPAGTNIGTFMTGLTSPFFILRRTNDYLVANSSGTDIMQYDTAGTFVAAFHSSTSLNFAQQLIQLPNGEIAVAGFSSPSGIVILSSTGTYVRTLTGVTGNRGVYLLPNGNFLTTNGTGLHEVDDTTGTLVRTIMAGANFQFIDLFNPTMVGVQNGSSNIPFEYKLENNYPNPFNPRTIINYQLPAAGYVKLTVYDVMGKEISVLVNERQNAGRYEIEFNGDNLPSGIYFYRLSADGYNETKKMILIK